MPTEDRGIHEKRQDKKRRNIQQTKYHNWNRPNRQNTDYRPLRNKRLRYFGHLNGMKKERYRYPKIAYNGYVGLHGTRKRGRQKKIWIDMIREDCRELHLTLQEATCRTQDRRVWRSTIDKRLARAMA